MHSQKIIKISKKNNKIICNNNLNRKKIKMIKKLNNCSNKKRKKFKNYTKKNQNQKINQYNKVI